ncbi:ABC transporter substrate-binding protein [Aliamphritea ceti]|uniref:ABC transporter substrate-binding protein n=1 Tax=Aliamphritea ceti TaxID=1524258 RepID=UPI0021C36A7A|nr:ABC transporter substrate-binding protein [Aliamphritea ceti]
MLPSTSTLAKESLTLRMLTWQGYAPKSQVEQFKSDISQRYDVKLNFEISYVTSSDDYFDAIRANRVDIIAPSHNVLNDSRYKFLDRALITPVNLDNIPNYASLIARLKTLNYVTATDKVFFIPLTYGPYGLAYNQQSLPIAPTSWKSLWNTVYAGKYTINSDYYEANIYITALAAGLNIEDISNIDKLNTPEIKQMLSQLASNANKLWSGVDTASDLSGHQLATSWGFSFPELSRRGESWKLACPQEGTTIWIDGHSLSRTLKERPLHKRIAEEWINFTLSKEFQKNAIYQRLNSFPANEETYSALKKAKALPHNEACIDFTFRWPELNSRQRNFMKSIWQQALKQANSPAKLSDDSDVLKAQ